MVNCEVVRLIGDKVENGENKYGCRFIYDENGALTLDVDHIEVMGRDVSVVSTNDASRNVVIRSIVSAENNIDTKKATVSFNLKPAKVFVFDKTTGERIRFEVK